ILLEDTNIEYSIHYTDDFSSSGHLYMTRLKGKDIQYRNNTIRKLAEMGVSANVHYKPLPLLTAYNNLGFKMQDYPNAYDMYKNEITLPLHTLLTDDDIEYIADALKKALI
ncbi:MAG: DegT/DnrJ/EryC1/StrS family aminotransferase, partial [Eubacteriaceae bacterium]